MAEQSLDSTTPGNRFDRMEFAGAFGDLGTLVPFLMAYIGVLKMDPYGILLAFGISMIVCGFFYRTPMPVQPMKAAGAIATTQAAQTIIITPAMVWGASLPTGIIWLLLGLTGTARHVARLINRPVVLGIILGLGFSFMVEGAKMMAQNWWIGGPTLLATSLLLGNRAIPAMFLLLLAGAGYSIVADPSLLDALRNIQVDYRTPTFALTGIGFQDLLLGTAFLALPQLPLTLGNAVVAIVEESNRLFPHRQVNESQIAISTGLMNLLSAGIGGVPMCHGAGGMAGTRPIRCANGRGYHHTWRRSAGHRPFFSSAVVTLLHFFPPVILGVILFLTGAQLSLGASDLPGDKGGRFVALITAALAIWNAGIAFVVCVLADWLVKKNYLKL